MNATPCHNKKSIISLTYKTKQTFRDLWLGSNQHALIGIQSVKLSNYVLRELDFMFGIRNAQDSEYTGLFHMEYIVNCIWTKPFVRIKANFGIHKIRNIPIILYGEVYRKLLPNALFKSVLRISDCYTIILQLLGKRAIVKTIDWSCDKWRHEMSHVPTTTRSTGVLFTVFRWFKTIG